MTLQGIRHVYSQDADDSSDEPGSWQEIIIESVDAGGGPYVVITTKRWAIDVDADLDQFIAAIRAVVPKEPNT